jgi:hypothetical protein
MLAAPDPLLALESVGSSPGLGYNYYNAMFGEDCATQLRLTAGERIDHFRGERANRRMSLWRGALHCPMAADCPSDVQLS